jgi:hypothetical protein
MPNEADQDALHFLDAHIHMLNHTAVEHARRDMPVTALRLQFAEAPQDNAFTTGETISNIR